MIKSKTSRKRAPTSPVMGTVIPACVTLCGVDWKQAKNKTAFYYELDGKFKEFFGDILPITQSNPHVKFVGAERSTEPYRWELHNQIAEQPNFFVIDQRNVNRQARELGLDERDERGEKIQSSSRDRLDAKLAYQLALEGRVQVVRLRPIDIKQRQKNETAEQRHNRERRISKTIWKPIFKQYPNFGFSKYNFPLYVYIIKDIVKNKKTRDELEVRLGICDGAPRSYGRATTQREINSLTKRALGIKKLPLEKERHDKKGLWWLTRIQIRKKFQKQIRKMYYFIKNQKDEF